VELAQFDYSLPKELIGQYPVEPRDHARMLVLKRVSGQWEHRRFRDLPEYLSPGDCLVLNQTRVIPARLYGRRPTGGKVEVLLVRRGSDGVWEALARPARRLRPGARILFKEGVLSGEVVGREAGRVLIRLESADEIEVTMDRLGEIPLPPYIHRPSSPEDRSWYQTVYARSPGSVASPTAGLHFTPELLNRIARKGVKIAKLVLHIGPGTFKPIATEQVESHQMDYEPYEISDQAAELIDRAKRVIAVGTSVVRALESADIQGGVRSVKGLARLFIYPGYHFRVVDALITNFHQPKSTPLLLVCAFAGREVMLQAYKEAIEQGYRFLSYGDGMLIL
jgi:S-adenosylmethionine:tRNA ribosyltransferase-isomerase